VLQREKFVWLSTRRRHRVTGAVGTVVAGCETARGGFVIACPLFPCDCATSQRLRHVGGMFRLPTKEVFWSYHSGRPVRTTRGGLGRGRADTGARSIKPAGRRGAADRLPCAITKRSFTSCGISRRGVFRRMICPGATGESTGRRSGCSRSPDTGGVPPSHDCLIRRAHTRKSRGMGAKLRCAPACPRSRGRLVGDEAHRAQF